MIDPLLLLLESKEGGGGFWTFVSAQIKHTNEFTTPVKAKYITPLQKCQIIHFSFVCNKLYLCGLNGWKVGVIVDGLIDATGISRII